MSPWNPTVIIISIDPYSKLEPIPAAFSKPLPAPQIEGLPDPVLPVVILRKGMEVLFK